MYFQFQEIITKEDSRMEKNRFKKKIYIYNDKAMHVKNPLHIIYEVSKQNIKAQKLSSSLGKQYWTSYTGGKQVHDWWIQTRIPEMAQSPTTLIKFRIKPSEISELDYPRKPPVVDVSADKTLIHQTEKDKCLTFSKVCAWDKCQHLNIKSRKI